MIGPSIYEVDREGNITTKNKLVRAVLWVGGLVLGVGCVGLGASTANPPFNDSTKRDILWISIAATVIGCLVISAGEALHTARLRKRGGRDAPRGDPGPWRKWFGVPTDPKEPRSLPPGESGRPLDPLDMIQDLQSGDDNGGDGDGD